MKEAMVTDRSVYTRTTEHEIRILIQMLGFDKTERNERIPLFQGGENTPSFCVQSWVGLSFGYEMSRRVDERNETSSTHARDGEGMEVLTKSFVLPLSVSRRRERQDPKV